MTALSMTIGVGALGFLAAGCLYNDEWRGAVFFGIVAVLWLTAECGRHRI